MRHCAECNLKVHNISAMTRDEAEGVLAGLATGRVCARFYRRADGTILVHDCPVGLAKIRARARRALVRVAALIGLASVTGVAAAATSSDTWGGRMRLRALKPFSMVCDWIAPGAPPAVQRQSWTAGAVCLPTPPTPAPPSGGGQR